MIKLKSLTNVRPKKDFGTQIILSPTPGTIKVTPNASKLLGVGSGDYLGIITADEGDTPGFVYKGNEDLGAKLAATGKGGAGVLNCSAANAWNELKGDVNYNVHYNVSETPISLTDEEKEQNPDFADVTIYPLEFDKREEKIHRGKSEESHGKSEAAHADAPGQNKEVAPVEEEEVEEEVQASTDPFDAL